MIRILLLIGFVASESSFAQDNSDAPIPYGNVPTAPEKPREEPRSLSSVDDPNVGLGVDFVGGVALLGSSKFGLDPRPFAGARLTWEFGRLMTDEYLREMFFTDVTWLYSLSTDGTKQVNVATHLHNFTIAPAFALPLGQTFMAAYAQIGFGVDSSYSVTQVDGTEVTLRGNKFLFQYGIGLRGRPALLASGRMRLQFRLEVTRFIRGYMHDMYIGGGLGLIF